MPADARSPRITQFALAIVVVATLATAALLVPDAHADFRDSSRNNSGWFTPYVTRAQSFDDGWIYSLVSKNSHETHVVRQRLPHRRREFVATLRTKSWQEISDLRVRGGRVAVGGSLNRADPADRTTDTTSELSFVAIANDGRFEMIALDASRPAAVCTQANALLDVTADGSAIVAHEWHEGLGGKCQVRRVHREVRTVAPGGAEKVLSVLVSSWGTFNFNFSIFGMASFSFGFWAGSSTVAATNDLVVTQFDGGEMRLERAIPPVSGSLPYVLNRRTWELSQEGRIISSRYGRQVPITKLFADPFNLLAGTPLNRPGMISYFHFCGDKIVEVARRGRKIYQDLARRHWRVSVRDHGGVWQRTLPHKLRRGTNFLGCDQKVARFESPTGGRPVFDLEPAAD